MEETSKNDRRYSIAPWILFVAATYISTPLWDPDLWWHVTIGRWILANKQVPSVDHWTLFAAGTPWVAYSWLPEVIFAAFDSVLSYQGLCVLKLASALALAFSFFYSFRLISNERRMSLFLAVFCTFSIFNHFALRPQVYTWALLALLLAASEVAMRNKEKLSRALTVIFCSSLFWANTHLTTVIALCAVASWTLSAKKLRVFALCVIAVFLGSLATPYGGQAWIVLIDKFLHPLKHGTIAEFRPASLIYFQTAFLLLTFFATVAFVRYRARVSDGIKIAAALVLFVGAWNVNKFTPHAIIYSCSLIAFLWKRFEEEGQGSKFEIGFEKLFSTLSSVPQFVTALICLVLTCYGMQSALSQHVREGYVPQEPVDFIIDYGLPHPILNEFAEGGYLMYRLSDPLGNLTRRVAIDGRTNVTPERIIDEYFEALRNSEKWHLYFSSVQPKTVLWRRMNPLVDRLYQMPEWCMVYLSDTHAIFVEKFEAQRLIDEDMIGPCLKIED